MPQSDLHPLQPGIAPDDDAALMARLYREHNQALINFLLTRVESEAEARDVAQEAYVRMLQLDRKGAISFLSGYLFKTAANIAIDRARNRATHRRITQDIIERPDAIETDTPERRLEARQQIRQIERFVAELPPKCRKAFYLHRLHDMSPPEIATRLGVSKRMVHAYIVQALSHIQTRFEQDPGAKEAAP